MHGFSSRNNHFTIKYDVKMTEIPDEKPHKESEKKNKKGYIKYIGKKDLTKNLDSVREKYKQKSIFI